MSNTNSPGDALSRKRKIAYIIVLGTLTALGPFTVDMYLPAFPAIQAQFGVSEADVQLTLTGTMIGFAVGQLFMGPLSDKVGRKMPLIASAVLHIGATVAAALATNILALGVLRVLMGFGAAASGVVAQAMLRDLFGGRTLVKMLSRLALVNGLAPVIAPVLGSQLLAVMNWQGIFWVLAAYGFLVTIAVILFVVETLPAERRAAQGKPLKDRYRALFSDRVFVGAVLVAGFNFAGLFSYLSTSPFLFQEVYGMTAQQYGWLFAINSLGVIFGVQSSARLMHLGLVPPQWILAGSTGVQIVLSLVIMSSDLMGGGFWGTAIPLWFYIAACGFGFPSVQILALANHGEEAGTAASLLGAINFGLAGALSPIIGLFGITNAIPMAIMMLVVSALGATALWGIIRPGKVGAVV